MSLCAPRPDVREATDDDLTALTELSPGERDYFTDRLDRQRRGLGQLVIAWLGERAVGQLYVWTEEADEQKIRERLPEVPLLQHAWVAEAQRRRGIGTSLFVAAERLLYNRGQQKVALAVEWTNVRAYRLYLTLGYSDWPHGLVECARRQPVTVDDPNPSEWCFVLVKNLSPEPVPTGRNTHDAANPCYVLPSSSW